MKKTTGILLLLFTCFSFCKSTIAQNITEKDYYNFINAIGAPDSAKNHFISSSSSNDFFVTDSNTLFHGNMHYINEAGDTLFNSADIKFIKQQLTQSKNYTWSNHGIKWGKLIKTKIIDTIFSRYGGWTDFQKKYKTHEFWEYSIPVFSVNKSLCAIYIGVHCGGLCGGGRIYIYKHMNNKWLLLKVYNLWVS